MAETPSSVSVNVVPTAPPPSKVSAKVWASTLATLVVSMILAVLTALLNDPASLQQFLDVVPAWARFIIVAALPTLVTFLAGYAKRDTTRELGQVVQDRLSQPEPVEGDANHNLDEVYADDKAYEGEHRAE